MHKRRLHFNHCPVQWTAQLGKEHLGTWSLEQKSNKSEGLPWIIMVCQSEVNQQGKCLERGGVPGFGFECGKQQRSMTELDGREENQGSVHSRANAAAQTSPAGLNRVRLIQSAAAVNPCVIITLKQVFPFLMHAWTSSVSWETKHLHFNVYFTENANLVLNKKWVNINCSGKKLLQKIIQTYANPCSTRPSWLLLLLAMTFVVNHSCLVVKRNVYFVKHVSCKNGQTQCLCIHLWAIPSPQMGVFNLCLELWTGF